MLKKKSRYPLFSLLLFLLVTCLMLTACGPDRRVALAERLMA